MEDDMVQTTREYLCISPRDKPTRQELTSLHSSTYANTENNFADRRIQHDMCDDNFAGTGQEQLLASVYFNAVNTAWS